MALALKVLHPRQPLSPGQTGTVGNSPEVTAGKIHSFIHSSNTSGCLSVPGSVSRATTGSHAQSSQEASKIIRCLLGPVRSGEPSWVVRWGLPLKEKLLTSEWWGEGCLGQSTHPGELIRKALTFRSTNAERAH